MGKRALVVGCGADSETTLVIAGNAYSSPLDSQERVDFLRKLVGETGPFERVVAIDDDALFAGLHRQVVALKPEGRIVETYRGKVPLVENPKPGKYVKWETARERGPFDFVLFPNVLGYVSIFGRNNPKILLENVLPYCTPGGTVVAWDFKSDWIDSSLVPYGVGSETEYRALVSEGLRLDERESRIRSEPLFAVYRVPAKG